MAKKCDISGKKSGVGNNVSKSNIKLKRTFAPNLQNATFRSELLKKDFHLKVCTRMIRTILKHGNLDTYLLHAKAANLSEFAQGIRRKLKKLSINKVA